MRLSQDSDLLFIWRQKTLHSAQGGAGCCGGEGDAGDDTLRYLRLHPRAYCLVGWGLHDAGTPHHGSCLLSSVAGKHTAKSIVEQRLSLGTTSTTWLGLYLRMAYHTTLHILALRVDTSHVTAPVCALQEFMRAFQCFMYEFWDLQTRELQDMLTDEKAKEKLIGGWCVLLPEATRICHIRRCDAHQ